MGKSRFKDIYFLCVILFSGLSTVFFRSHIGLIVLFIFGLFIFRFSAKNISKQFLLSLFIWVLYFTLNSFSISSFHPFFFSTYVIYFTIAWWLISYYKLNIFIKYESIMYILTIISLVFYLIHNSFLGEVLNEIILSLDMSGNLYPENDYASIILYSLRNFDDNYFLIRNQGFTWEPGPFSCFISLAIFFNLIRNNSKFNDKKRLIIFLIGIISTQSTTGFLMVFAISIWLYLSRQKSNFIRSFGIPIMLLVFSVISFNTPFLQEKIVSEFEQDVLEVIDNSIKYDATYNPGRFASFQLALIDLQNYPILGIGGNKALRYATSEGASVNTISGIGMIMTQYGIVGLILFLFLLFRTGYWLLKTHSLKGSMIFPILILIISFSFNIIQSPIIISLIMSSFYLKQKSIIKL